MCAAPSTSQALSSEEFDVEEAIIRAVEAHKSASFLAEPLDDPPHALCLLAHKPDKRVSAEFIRKLLLGSKLRVPHEQVERPVAVTDYGFRLSGVTVAGDLDLDDLARGNSSHPRLEFRNCWFENEIHLRRARLRSLAISKCRFKTLLASDAWIDGPVDISLARSSEGPDSQCWVVLAGCRIGGRVNVARSHFMAPPKREEREWVPESRHPAYALDLRGTEIQGSVQARPAVRANGGICLTLSRVEGSVWCNGATLTGIEDAAFAADYATIRGSIYMRPYEHPHAATASTDVSAPFSMCTIESQRTVVEGSVSLFAANVRGSLYMAGASLTPKRAREGERLTEDDRMVVDASNASFGGNCFFTCWQPQPRYDERPLIRFRASGLIVLESTKIHNDLSFCGAYVDEIIAPNAEIGGSCKMTVHKPERRGHEYSFRAKKSVLLNGATIRGTLDASGARIGPFPGAEADPDAPDMSHSFISSGLLKRCAAEDESYRPPRGAGLAASSISVTGNVILTPALFTRDAKENGVSSFECFGQIVFREATLQNSLRLDGAIVIGPADRACVDLSGAVIGGQATFKVWTEHGAAEGVPFRLIGGTVGLRLTGAEVGERLFMNGAALSSTKVALEAPNVRINGKAKLSSYTTGSKTFHFSAKGLVQLSSATLGLGLYMQGAELLPPQHGKSPNNKRTQAISLNLSLAKVKLIQLKGGGGRPFESWGQVSLHGATVDSSVEVVDAVFRQKLDLEYVDIESSMVLQNVTLCGTGEEPKALGPGSSLANRASTLDRHIARDPEMVCLAMRGASIGGELRVIGIKTDYDSSKAIITVDLRSAVVEELNDLGGRGWGRAVCFWLEGFAYKRLTDVATIRPNYHPKLRARVRRMLNRFVNPTWLPTTEDAPAEYEPWESRLRWLRMQYRNPEKPARREFQPAPYEQVVSSWNSTGSYKDARRINSAKLSDSSVDRGPILRFFQWIFRASFDYGLSGTRSILTFAGCIVLGALAVKVANGEIHPYAGFRPALIATVGLPPTVVVGKGEFRVIYAAEASGQQLHDPEELPCGHRIHAALYALDVFVPVLDLHQQAVCEIAPDRIGWRISHAVYAVLGWILTPLMFLSTTGIIRRHIER